jgi:hypothetical protein
MTVQRLSLRTRGRAVNAERGSGRGPRIRRRTTATVWAMGDHPRYRIEAGLHCVDIRLNTIEQLFDNRDPAPFRERDLDPDLVEYLVAAAEDLAPLGKFKVVFWIAQQCVPEEVQTGYQAHFAYELERIDRRKRRQRRTGQVALVLGLVLLAVLLSISELLSPSASRAVRILREGLAILSWVVMWRPVEALIYDWLPIRRERKTMERLREAPTEVQTGKGP